MRHLLSLRRLRVLGRMNWTMAITALALIVIGIVFISSAGHTRRDLAVLYERQISWVLLGSVFYAAAALMDYRRFRTNAWWYYLLACAALVLVLVMGAPIYGARRWLNLFGVGLQPSELAKVAIIVTLAWYLSQPGLEVRRLRTLGIALAIVGVPMVLIMKEPDLGSAMILTPVTLAMMFVGGISGRYLAAMLGVGALVVAFVLGVMLLPERLGMSDEAEARLQRMTGLSGYQQDRIRVFVQPDRQDTRKTGWNRKQSIIAVGSGGSTGKGYRKGTQNLLGFLPRNVAPTDFIFAVIAEETGYAGAVVLLTLYAILLTCGMWTAMTATDKLGRLLCVGLVVMLFGHVFVNIAMTVGLMPIKGLPLPLVSYGGSFVLAALIALGIIQSVHIHRRES